EPLGRKLIRQPLHALPTGRPHLGDLRYGEGADERETAQKTERAGAPVGNEPRLLTKRAQAKEELRNLEHQVRDRLALPGDPMSSLSLRRSRHCCSLRRCRHTHAELTPLLSMPRMTIRLSFGQ